MDKGDGGGAGRKAGGKTDQLGQDKYLNSNEGANQTERSAPKA